MCLRLVKGNNQQKIASEDIVVYKVLHYDGTNFLTFFQFKPVEIGRTYESTFSFNYFGGVEMGLHSFSNLQDALNGQERLVCRCIIPKGSAYYEGWFANMESYASNRLTYVELLNPELLLFSEPI